MSGTIKIDVQKELIVILFTGPVNAQDIRDCVDEALENEDFSNSYAGVADIREASFEHLLPENVQALSAYMDARDFTAARWAILVSQPKETALSILFSRSVARSHLIGIFSTVAAGAGFISRNPDAIELLLA